MGPGTGAVTRQIVASLRPHDQLDLVELNESFVACLRERFRSEAEFLPVSDRVRVLHCPVEELGDEAGYHVIVSGLPLNNFTVEQVRRILEALKKLAAPGATLSFFEYVAVRRLKGMLSNRAERCRLREIGREIGHFLEEHEVQRLHLAERTPAWVHHARL